MTPEEIRLECLRLAVSLSRSGVDDAPAVLDLAEAFEAHIGMPLRLGAGFPRTQFGRDLLHHAAATQKDPPPGADLGGGSEG